MSQMSDGQGPPSAGLLATARSLAVDAVTAEVVRSFRDAGIEPILLKGPSLMWLYDDGAARYYMDSDLLVRRDRLAEAEAVLGELGFARRETPVMRPAREEPHSEPWFRGSDRGEVDLHSTLFGLGVSPAQAWATVSAETETMTVGGVEVLVLGMRARILLVALHAAQHGSEKAKPLEDLSRALARVPERQWANVAQLAADLHTTQNFSRGLRLLPEGDALAQRLGLVKAELAELAAMPDSPAALVMGLDRLAATRGVMAKGRLVLRELFPPPSFLRWWTPLARRRWGLPAAYAWRLLWLTRRLPASLTAWRRGRVPG